MFFLILFSSLFLILSSVSTSESPAQPYTGPFLCQIWKDLAKFPAQKTDHYWNKTRMRQEKKESKNVLNRRGRTGKPHYKTTSDYFHFFFCLCLLLCEIGRKFCAIFLDYYHIMCMDLAFFLILCYENEILLLLVHTYLPIYIYDCCIFFLHDFLLIFCYFFFISIADM